MYWCPVLGGWVQQTAIHAAHIFPHKLGQNMMTQIFGFDTAKPEMMELQNALILSAEAAESIDDNKVVIVPDVDDIASNEAIDKWTRSEPKGYKIRIVDLSQQELDNYLSCIDGENARLS